MALVVENGSGLSNAESYASVVAATTRLNLLGNDTWDLLSEVEMEEALRRATTFMEQSYRMRWRGNRVTATQALSWPRHSVYVDGFAVESNTVPAAVVNACSDLALKAAAGDLAPDIERAIIREKIGPIETEWSVHSSPTTQYRAIDMTLAPFLRGSGANVWLVRA